jgi:hypothetical protein
MGLENVNRCQHVKVNGTQCGSPALRRRRMCFFHVRCQEQRARIVESQFKQARFVLPLLEDGNAVQMALMQVMQLLATGQMEHKMAVLMLYALQTASCNLRNTKFEASDVTDVVIDRSTVNATCIDGQQWVEEDFDEEMGEEIDEEEDGEEDEEDQDDGAEEDEEVAEVAAESTAARVKSRASESEEHVSMDEARRQVQKVVLDWVVETVKAEAATQVPG